MIHRCCPIVFAAFLVLLAGCTDESVRLALPDSHPANPLAQVAPFVPPPDPFAGVSLPSRPAEIPGHRHEHRAVQPDDDMRMDDMRMDNDQQGQMEHGGHGGDDAAEEEEKR